MKKCWLIFLMLSILLCGCASEQTVERVLDEVVLPAIAPLRELKLQLPSGASQPVLSQDTDERLYFCDGYVMTVQTLTAGDLDRTVRILSGYSKEELTLMQTKIGGVKRYDWIWSCAGEAGDQIGRAAVLDDGDYHYCVTVMAEEALVGSLDAQWDAVFSSLSLA